MTALLIGAVVSKPPTKRHSSRRRPGHLAGSLAGSDICPLTARHKRARRQGDDYGWREFGLAASTPSFGRSLLLRDTAQIELSPGRAEPCESKAIDATLPGQELVRIQAIPATRLVQR